MWQRVLVATVPLWMAIFDWLRPKGPRPTFRIAVGLAIGLAGVGLLVSPGDPLLHTAGSAVNPICVRPMSPAIMRICSRRLASMNVSFSAIDDFRLTIADFQLSNLQSAIGHRQSSMGNSLAPASCISECFPHCVATASFAGGTPTGRGRLPVRLPIFDFPIGNLQSTIGNRQFSSSCINLCLHQWVAAASSLTGFTARVAAPIVNCTFNVPCGSPWGA